MKKRMTREAQEMMLRMMDNDQLFKVYPKGTGRNPGSHCQVPMPNSPLYKDKGKDGTTVNKYLMTCHRKGKHDGPHIIYKYAYVPRGSMPADHKVTGIAHAWVNEYED